MTRRRITTVIATAAVAVLATVGAGAAEADPADPIAVPVDDEYWACTAVDVAAIGACLENPLPDLSGLPPVRQVLYDLTGVPI